MANYVLRGIVQAAIGFFGRQRVSTVAVTAKAGGTKAAATPITRGVTVISVCATAADSVLLPSPKSGDQYLVLNKGAAAAQVFAAGTATIDGVATGTGVVLTNAKSALFLCLTDGAYISAQLGAPSA